MRREITFQGKKYNMIEDGAYKDDNGYYIVHAYDPLEQPDLSVGRTAFMFAQPMKNATISSK